MRFSAMSWEIAGYLSLIHLKNFGTPMVSAVYSARAAMKERRVAFEYVIQYCREIEQVKECAVMAKSVTTIVKRTPRIFV